MAADVTEIAAIERTVFPDPWPAEAFHAQLARREAWVAVAEAAGTVVGYVVVIIAADEAEIANIATSVDWRGMGVGAGLLDAALHECAGRGVEATYLEVRESNAPARRLYASRGFTGVGRRRGYYRNPTEDAIVLRFVTPPPAVA